MDTINELTFFRYDKISPSFKQYAYDNYIKYIYQGKSNLIFLNCFQNKNNNQSPPIREHVHEVICNYKTGELINRPVEGFYMPPDDEKSTNYNIETKKQYNYTNTRTIVLFHNDEQKSWDTVCFNQKYILTEAVAEKNFQGSISYKSIFEEAGVDLAELADKLNKNYSYTLLVTTDRYDSLIPNNGTDVRVLSVYNRKDKWAHYATKSNSILSHLSDLKLRYVKEEFPPVGSQFDVSLIPGLGHFRISDRLRYILNIYHNVEKLRRSNRDSTIATLLLKGGVITKSILKYFPEYAKYNELICLIMSKVIGLDIRNVIISDEIGDHFEKNLSFYKKIVTDFRFKSDQAISDVVKDKQLTLTEQHSFITSDSTIDMWETMLFHNLPVDNHKDDDDDTEQQELKETTSSSSHQ